MANITRKIRLIGETSTAIPRGYGAGLENPEEPELKKIPIPIKENNEVSPVFVEIDLSKEPSVEEELSVQARQDKGKNYERSLSHSADTPFFWNYEQEIGEGHFGLKLDEVLLDLERYELFFDELFVAYEIAESFKSPPRFYCDHLYLTGNPVNEKVFAETTERVEKTRAEILRLAKLFDRKVKDFTKKLDDREAAFVSAFDWLSREIFSRTKYEKGRNQLVDIFAPESGVRPMADCEGRAKAIASVLNRVWLGALDDKGRATILFDIEWEFFRDHVRVVVKNCASQKSFVLENGVRPLEEERKTARFSIFDVIRYFCGDLSSLSFPGGETGESVRETSEVKKTSATTIYSAPSLEYYHQTPEAEATDEKNRPRMVAVEDETENQNSDFTKNLKNGLTAGVTEIQQVLLHKVAKEGRKVWQSQPRSRRNLVKDLALVSMLTAAGGAYAGFSDRLGKLEDLSSTIVDTGEELSSQIETPKSDSDLSINFVSELDRRWQEEWTTHFDGTDYLVRLGSEVGPGSVLVTSTLEENMVCDEINITPEFSERLIGQSFWKQLAREAAREAGDAGYEVERTVVFTSPNSQIPLAPDNVIGKNGIAIREAFDAIQNEGLKLPSGSLRVILDGQELAEIPFVD